MILDGIDNCAPSNEQERQLAERLHFSPAIRLACQTLVNDDVLVRRLVLDAEDIELSRQLTSDVTPVSVGEEKMIAILFADIRGFTSFAESLPPYDVIYVLNRYFHQMGQVINRHGGYIDNYMGDGLMALFGVDEPQEAALKAVRAGLAMLEALAQLKPYLENVYDMSFQIGIGIHYGEVVVGSIGAEGRKRMTAIGDAVNFASRIEAANKINQTQLLISEGTYREVEAHVHTGKQCGNVTLPGKSGSYNLYEIVGMR
jgi:adenylate cyclase